ncbi:MAG: 50S ribosomal protein L3 [Candidatus Woesearchaeota archaeon]
MAKTGNPRHGSMQYWPRVRAKKETPRVRFFAQTAKDGVVGFAAYKAGMTQVQYTDNRKTSLTKGQALSVPVTILECPPISVIGFRYYSQTQDGFKTVYQQNAKKLPVEVKKRLGEAKKTAETKEPSQDSLSFVRLIVATQPKATGFAKKVADIFELPIQGSIEQQIAYAKEQLGKSIAVSDVYAPGDLLDVHAVTKGKGYQGPVKRFGVSLRQQKSEKTRRGPGSLGGWKAQGHVMYRIAYAGQTGYHLRTEHNKKLLFIGDDVSKVNPQGGIVRYGVVKTTYILVSGSVAGPKKRLVLLTPASRPSKKLGGDAPAIDAITTAAQN